MFSTPECYSAVDRLTSLNMKSIKITTRCFLSSLAFVLKDQNWRLPKLSFGFAFSESVFLVIFLKFERTDDIVILALRVFTHLSYTPVCPVLLPCTVPVLC